MIEGTTSFVKALKDFFEMTGTEAVREFKELTVEDKKELHGMLCDLGYDLLPLGVAV